MHPRAPFASLFLSIYLFRCLALVDTMVWLDLLLYDGGNVTREEHGNKK